MDIAILFQIWQTWYIVVFENDDRNLKWYCCQIAVSIEYALIEFISDILTF